MWEHLAVSNSERWLDLGLVYHLNKRRINFWRSGETKEKDFELLRTAKCRKANIWGS